jgi:hypothetical protein
LTKYAPRGIRNQDRLLKRLLDVCDRKGTAMASEMMMMTATGIFYT